jgi:hypothetical protein
MFIFFHRQTKDIEIGDKDVLYSNEFMSSLYHVRFLKDCPTDLHKIIKDLIVKKSMCFSDNEVGEIVRNWLMEDQGVNGLL